MQTFCDIVHSLKLYFGIGETEEQGKSSLLDTDSKIKKLNIVIHQPISDTEDKLKIVKPLSLNGEDGLPKSLKFLDLLTAESLKNLPSSNPESLINAINSY